MAAAAVAAVVGVVEEGEDAREWLVERSRCYEAPELDFFSRGGSRILERLSASSAVWETMEIEHKHMLQCTS